MIRRRVRYWDDQWRATWRWLVRKADGGLDLTLDQKKRINIVLPPVMNFSTDYELTATCMQAIRRLSSLKNRARRAYKLGRVEFSNLTQISTSAALVLTAELSKWEDYIQGSLTPFTQNWRPEILLKFERLGFFDLFQKRPKALDLPPETPQTAKIVRYIKGSASGKEHKVLKDKIVDIVGKTVDKWTFLRSGLNEAITNVSHHAYPNSCGVEKKHRNWYLTGSYVPESKELKIVFYDQGIGIPRSLPSSKLYEKVLAFLSAFPPIQRKQDSVLLQAAIEVDRTSTGEDDRGKGLQDMLEFIRQRRDGYLSILSQHGLYKYTIDRKGHWIKTETFGEPISGTLIIWKVNL